MLVQEGEVFNLGPLINDRHNSASSGKEEGGGGREKREGVSVGRARDDVFLSLSFTKLPHLLTF